MMKTEMQPNLRPGEMLERAIGEMMGKTLSSHMSPLAGKCGCHYLGPAPEAGVKLADLNLRDDSGEKHRVDAAIFNGKIRPLVLAEFKHIFGESRSFGEGERICRAHRSLRNRFHSIRKSVAVLAGSWTHSSIAAIRNARVDAFLVPFDKISTLLAKRGVDFERDEKDRDAAVRAWMTYDRLSPQVKREIAECMIADIREGVCDAVDSVLQRDTKSAVKKVTVKIRAATGEIYRERFKTVESAARYLNEQRH